MDRDLKITLAEYTIDRFSPEIRNALVAALADEDTETWEGLRRLALRCRDLARSQFDDWHREFQRVGVGEKKDEVSGVPI